MDAKVKALRAEVAAWRRGGKRRFPTPLRQRVVALARDGRERGRSVWRTATDLGLGVQCLQGWVADAGRRFRPVRMQAVTATAAVVVARPVLVTAQGHRVEGLDAAGIAELLRQLA
jgi:transposase-like protein